MLLKYFLKDFEMVPVAPVITGVTFVFTFHMLYISIIRYNNNNYYYYYYYGTKRNVYYYAGSQAVPSRPSREGSLKTKINHKSI
jgi:hypothetical protein